MRYIFQTWKKHDLSEAHPFFRLSQNSWMEHHPEWDYEFFDDDEIAVCVEELAPKYFRRYFQRLNAQIQRVDMFRYVNLFNKGGLYSDLDGECICAFDEIYETSSADHFIGALKSKESQNRYPNALMLSRASKCNFWLYVIAVSIMRFENDKGYYSTEFLTGPILLTDCILSYREKSLSEILETIDEYIPDNIEFNRSRKEELEILSYRRVYPIDWIECNEIERKKLLRHRVQDGVFPTAHIFPETIYINYWTYTWSKPNVTYAGRILIRLRSFAYRVNRLLKFN